MRARPRLRTCACIKQPSMCARTDAPAPTRSRHLPPKHCPQTPPGVRGPSLLRPPHTHSRTHTPANTTPPPTHTHIESTQCDRLYDWKSAPDTAIREALKRQKEHVAKEFDDRAASVFLQLNEQVGGVQGAEGTARIPACVCMERGRALAAQRAGGGLGLCMRLVGRVSGLLVFGWGRGTVSAGDQALSHTSARAFTHPPPPLDAPRRA